MQDAQIVNGLKDSPSQRAHYEKGLYLQYNYFINEGCRKYRLTYEDSFSAYTDAVLAVIHNIINGRYEEGNASLKTYLFHIFSNKCIDLIRKTTNIKEKVHLSAVTPELLNYLPDAAKTIVDKLIDREKIAMMKQHLETIGEKCKEILLLFEDGLSDKAIAEQLHYGSAAVAKTTRLRCREKLKNLVYPL